MDENQEVFRHNGIHFTEKDIKGLINQISSKEVEGGEKTNRTGRFGTGFLTTHLLSRKSNIEGIIETDSLETFRFKFPLDRSGNTISELVPLVENAWTELHTSVERVNSNYNDEFGYNTSFTYQLHTKEQKEIASIGIRRSKRKSCNENFNNCGE
ncbi:hypothetical protein [Algoriphagus sp. PAP.12]|uniref:hypothetical protein n=1 Tax=Algoriphagus sp. PAP.12 TaxID=2996678 RepID=UPI00227A50AE|nr:hypothetical protein [Algoriphagus sp. PAP.12]